MSAQLGISIVAWRPILVLLAFQAFVFAVFVPSLGFYTDDWFFLKRMSEAGVSWRSLVSLTRTGDMSRPLDYLYFLSLYAVGGMKPLAYNIAIQFFLALEAVLLFCLFERMLRWRALALIGALMAVALPCRDASRVWFVNSVQIVSHCVFLGSLLLHMRWLERRRWGCLAGSLGLYLASFLLYESCIFLPVMLGGAAVVSGRLNGKSVPKALQDAALELWPYLFPFGLGLLWQWVVLPYAFGVHAPKSAVVGFSPLHAARVYGQGFVSLTGAGFWLSIITAPESWKALGVGFALAWAGLAVGVTAAIGAEVRAFVPSDPDRSLRIALGAAAACFVAAYIPYALSSGYVPRAAGLMSRTNGSGVWAGGLLLASALMAAWRIWPRVTATALAALLCAFAWVDGHAMRQYQRAWAIQQDILAKVAPRAAQLPRNATVLLINYVAYAAGIAVVFDASWDFISALRITAGRPDLSGTVVTTRIRVEEDALVEYGNIPPKRIPYQNLFAYDHGLDVMIPVTGPRSLVHWKP